MYYYELGFRGIEKFSSQWGQLKEFSAKEGQRFYIEKRFKNNSPPTHIKFYGVNETEINRISDPRISSYSYDGARSELTINLTSQGIEKLLGTSDSKIRIPVEFSNDSLTEGLENIKVQMFFGSNEVANNYLENNPSTLDAAKIRVTDTSKTKSVSEIELELSDASEILRGSNLLSLSFTTTF